MVIPERLDGQNGFLEQTVSTEKYIPSMLLDHQITVTAIVNKAT